MTRRPPSSWVTASLRSPPFASPDSASGRAASSSGVSPSNRPTTRVSASVSWGAPERALTWIEGIGAVYERSDLEPCVLQIQLPLHPPHDVGTDVPAVPQSHERLALRVQHAPHRLLVGQRPVLVAVVLGLAGPRREAPLAVAVHRAHPLERVLADRAVGLERVELIQRGLRRGQPRAQLLALLGGAVL